MEDVEIVNLYWDRNEAAIRESDAKYGNMLLKIAYNITAADGTRLFVGICENPAAQ